MLCQAWELRAGKSAACPTNSDRYREGAGRVMERNNDGKKSRGSHNPGIVPDTRVPWHRLSPATRYRGIRSRSDSWLADTDRPSYIYPCGDAGRRCPLEAKPACFPREGGRAGAGREQMCGASSTWALGHGATATMLCQRPGTVLLGVSHLGAINPPVRVGWGVETQQEVHPGSHPSKERWQLSPSQSPVQIHGVTGVHQLGLAKR